MPCHAVAEPFPQNLTSWTAGDGTWQVVSGVLEQQATDSANATFEILDQRAYGSEVVVVTQIFGAGKPGIVFRASGA